MNFNFLVGYTVAENKREGIQAHEKIVAGFELYENAEDFIKKCLPAENIHRFFIEITWNNKRITF